MLDDAVLKRMVRDHHNSSTPAKQSGNAAEKCFELLQLAIDSDAECLEDSAERIGALPRMNTPLDNRTELARRSDRRELALQPDTFTGKKTSQTS